jgi:hypothetical protein
VKLQAKVVQDVALKEPRPKIIPIACPNAVQSWRRTFLNLLSDSRLHHTSHTSAFIKDPAGRRSSPLVFVGGASDSL